MKIAVPVTNNNQIENHFGHCKFYNVYTVLDNRILDVQNIESEQGCGCKSNIANVLKEQGVTTMLAGGIGGGAVAVLNRANIEVIRGCSGTPEDIINQFVSGSLKDSGVSCQHHENHHGHDHVCNH